MRQARVRRLVIAVAVLGVCFYFGKQMFWLPALTAHQGDGAFADISRRAGPLAIPGYSVTLPEFELAKPFEAEYHLTRLPNIGRQCLETAMFVLAGWCERCVARALLFARCLASGRIFYVCAACAGAGATIHECDSHISQVHLQLAPNGWTLASLGEVTAAGLGSQVQGEALESYADLISWYPGFRPPLATVQ